MTLHMCVALDLTQKCRPCRERIADLETVGHRGQPDHNVVGEPRMQECEQ
jgi:hypothetical protein